MRVWSYSRTFYRNHRSPTATRFFFIEGLAPFRYNKVMHKILSFIKTTLLGGVLVVLPAWLTALLLVKVLMKLEVFVKPVSSHLPRQAAHPQIIAILLLLALCFAVGAMLRTAIGRSVERALEENVLSRLPGYRTLRSIAQQMADLEDDRGFKPALIEIEEALAPGFVIEEHADGRLTVFVPSVPTPAAGTLYIIDAARVHPVHISVAKMFNCIAQWGTGSGELLAAMQTVKRDGAAENAI
jgi:uncharacterized membrane protein